MSSHTASELIGHQRALSAHTLKALFAADPARVDKLSWLFDGWRIDLSKERIDATALDLLLGHARACDLAGWIAALSAGERVNLSEQRPALHMALRQRTDASVRVDGVDVVPQIRAAQARMAAIERSIRSGDRRGATGQPFRHVVNLGIGGSDLGPRLVCDALATSSTAGATAAALDVRFVSNVDPAHLTRALAGLEPAATLFIVTSKTFTTQETLANARSARAWLSGALPPGADTATHFIAISGNTKAAQAFGMRADDVLPLWDYVGGRYSLWSPAGLSIVLALGYARFSELLDGAASIDDHFRSAPLQANIPVVLGLLGYWNARVLGHAQRVVVPYAQALAYLPAYLQQLVLESNGKRVTRDGGPVDGSTSASLWGTTGTDGQHAFFQWLHQGTHEVPVEFIVPVRATTVHDERQTLLVGNAIAQAQALLEGRSAAALRASLTAANFAAADLDAAVAARVCPGNRASTTLLMPEVNAYRLGQLLALYEHRTFVEGVLFGINPFDQFGVELGKTLAGPVTAALAGTGELSEGTDASTRALVMHARAIGSG